MEELRTYSTNILTGDTAEEREQKREYALAEANEAGAALLAATPQMVIQAMAQIPWTDRFLHEQITALAAVFPDKEARKELVAAAQALDIQHRMVRCDRVLDDPKVRFVSPVLSTFRLSPEGMKLFYGMFLKRILEFQADLNLHVPMTSEQITRAAIAICDDKLSEFGIEDIPLFLQRALAGRYGKLEYTLNAAKLGDMLEKYLAERDEERLDYLNSEGKKKAQVEAEYFKERLGSPENAEKLAEIRKHIAANRKPEVNYPFGHGLGHRMRITSLTGMYTRRYNDAMLAGHEDPHKTAQNELMREMKLFTFEEGRIWWFLAKQAGHTEFMERIHEHYKGRNEQAEKEARKRMAEEQEAKWQAMQQAAEQKTKAAIEETKEFTDEELLAAIEKRRLALESSEDPEIREERIKFNESLAEIHHRNRMRDRKTVQEPETT